MTIEKVSLNQRFKELLQCYGWDCVSRKELIQKAALKFDLSLRQSEGFVARNIHTLQRRKLIKASGGRGKRIYHISHALKSLLDQSNSAAIGLSDVSEELGDMGFITEKEKVCHELKIIFGEVRAYKELWKKYPNSRVTIEKLLKESENECSMLHGKLNALKKLIDAHSS